METISANIDLKEVTGPVHAKSISGYVDMHWPSKQGASVAMKTITGEVYSDLDINFLNKKDTPQIVGYLLKGTPQRRWAEMFIWNPSATNQWLKTQWPCCCVFS
jgi:hypothetical protein